MCVSHTFSQTSRATGFALSGLSHTRTDDLFNLLTSTQLLLVLSTTALSVEQNAVSNGYTLAVEKQQNMNEWTRWFDRNISSYCSMFGCTSYGYRLERSPVRFLGGTKISFKTDFGMTHVVSHLGGTEYSKTHLTKRQTQNSRNTQGSQTPSPKPLRVRKLK